jgi:Ca-activated chloride channel family protein
MSNLVPDVALAAWVCLSLTVGLAASLAPLPAFADATLAGSVEAELDGQRVVFPLLKTDVLVDIQGDVANVKVVQTFENPLSQPIHARYLFPLNKDAAVHRMSMRVGDEIVRARIQEVRQAERTFQQAKSEGKAAALLKQVRPNMFTQQIANLMPGVPIRVEIEYAQIVPRVDERYRLVVPLVVGPRFQPPGSGIPPEQPPARSDVQTDDATTFGQWEVEALPVYPEVFGLTVPDSVEAERVSLMVRLEAGMPIADVASDTHALTVQAPSERVRVISLGAHPGGRTIDNRDFVLSYSLAGERSQAGLLAHYDERGGFFSLLIEPPVAPLDAQILPREMVFLLDCSGSMNGLPMEASKAFMRAALRSLRPTDSFRIIRFSDSATEFSTTPLPATPFNVRRGLRYTQGLYGSGGTMMTSGIRQALGARQAEETVRIVVFLTDGYIGNELEVLRLVERELGDARLYAFGVGTGVNRYLLSELGRVGRGFTRYMDPTEDVDEVARSLAGRLESPILADIEIDWGDLRPEGLSPTRIPDLFAGDSIRVQGRYAAPGTYQLAVKGRLRERDANLPLEVTLPDASDASHPSAAIATIWARSAVADAMHRLVTPQPRRPAMLSDADIKQQVTTLGLEFALVTRWTSFVAVSERIYNASPDATDTRDVPLSMVEGVASSAYPGSHAGAPAAFGGYAAPEPGAWASLALLSALLGLFARSHFRRLPVRA